MSHALNAETPAFAGHGLYLVPRPAGANGGPDGRVVASLKSVARQLYIRWLILCIFFIDSIYTWTLWLPSLLALLY